MALPEAPLHNILIENGTITEPWWEWFTLVSVTYVVRDITRVTTTPYSIIRNDYVIFLNTDATIITANLPAGIQGTEYKIVNTGTSGNDVTLVPNGTENLFGTNGSTAITDGNNLTINFDETDGWY